MQAKKKKRKTLVTVDLGNHHYALLSTALIAVAELRDKPIRFRYHPVNKSDVIRLALECLERQIKEGTLPTVAKEGSW